MKKLLLLLVTILISIMASANAIEIDGVFYNLVSKVKKLQKLHMEIGTYIILKLMMADTVEPLLFLKSLNMKVQHIMLLLSANWHSIAVKT